MGGAKHGRNYLKSVNHYFTLPNEIFCLGLSSGEIAVYSYLLRCENRKNISVLSELPHNRKSSENESEYGQKICSKP